MRPSWGERFSSGFTVFRHDLEAGEDGALELLRERLLLDAVAVDEPDPDLLLHGLEWMSDARLVTPLAMSVAHGLMIGASSSAPSPASSSASSSCLSSIVALVTSAIALSRSRATSP